MLRENEDRLLARLRSGDEAAFSDLFDELNVRLQGLARTFTSSPPLAEDIVQETWLAVISGLRGFEGRSTLRTWIFSILVRRARTMSSREKRRQKFMVRPRGAAADGSIMEWEPGRGRIGLWEETPKPWRLDDPAAVLQNRELMAVLEQALALLPEKQRQVVLLRDVEGVPSADVCNILEISETNQRVLLHRGRSRIRNELDRYLRDETIQLLPSASRTNGARAERERRPVTSSSSDGLNPARE